jgi:putative chitobiose transport system substrate-binding protein
MRQLTWRQLSVSVLLGVFASGIVGCAPTSTSGPGEQSSGGQTTAAGAKEVEFWTMQLQPEFTDFFNQLIAKFEQENPGIKVRWVDVPWQAMESKILTSVSAKTAPDVVNLNPDFSSRLASRNAWLELDDKVTPEVQQLYLKNIWQANSLNGKTFALPWYLTTRVTIYNSDLFKKAGVAKPPATYEELVQVAKQIKAKTGKYAFFITFVPGDSTEVLQSFVQKGVNLLDADGKAAFNTPQGKAVFQYWVDFYKQGLLPKDALTEGHRRAIELYQSGETAILASGPEFLKTIETNAPAISKVSVSAPQISGSTGKKGVAVMNLVIPRATDQPEAALKFAEYISNDENQLAFAKAANVLPSTNKALADYETFVGGSQASPVEKARAVSAGELRKAEILIPPRKDIKELQRIIYENLQAAMLDQKSVDQAVTDAATTWNTREP